MDKPKHFGKLGRRAAVPWVRCPLCGDPMVLRQKADKTWIYGCSSRGDCNGQRQQKAVDAFFDKLDHADVVSAVAEVNANGGKIAHLTHPDGPENKFLCRRSQIGLSRVIRAEQFKRLAAEKKELAHIIPGQWNPLPNHMALLAVAQDWGGVEVPEGALVLISDVVNEDTFMVSWPLGPKQKQAEWHEFKVQRDCLRSLRPGETLWSIDEDGKTATGRSSVEQYGLLLLRGIDPDKPTTYTVVVESSGKEVEMKFSNSRLIAVVNGTANIGSFFRAEGVARVLRIREIEVEDVVYVTGDNGGRWRLSEIELLSDEEIEADPEPAKKVESDSLLDNEEFDFGF